MALPFLVEPPPAPAGGGSTFIYYMRLRCCSVRNNSADPEIGFLFLTSSKVVFLIFPIYTTFQSVTNTIHVRRFVAKISG